MTKKTYFNGIIKSNRDKKQVPHIAVKSKGTSKEQKAIRKLRNP